MRCAVRPAGSTSTTTRRSRLPGCWSRERTGSPTSTSTSSITAMACRSLTRSWVVAISLHEHPATLFPWNWAACKLGATARLRRQRRAARGDRRFGLAGARRDGARAARAFAAAGAGEPARLRRHRLDPLAHLEVSVDGQRKAQSMLRRLAHETAGGRSICTGGGGYALVAVVPRSCDPCSALATTGPSTRPEPTPAAWREQALQRTGMQPPELTIDEQGATANFVPYSCGLESA